MRDRLSVTMRARIHRIIHGAAVTLALGATVPARAQTLAGAIDLHAHADPDGTPRKIDAIDLARAAKAAGMRAIVIKNHYEPTASLAYLVRKEVPGIEVFGGISLDLTVGGVNPAAVEWMTKVKGGFGKVIWLPTFDSEAQVKLDKQSRPFAPVTRNGKILPEVLQVIALAAKHDLVLEMGHSAPSESLMMIAEAKRQGVKHVLVTHAMTNPGGPMSLEEMQQAARLGALLELVYSPFTDGQLQQAADAIRTIGAASFVLSSDLGQPQNPLHTDGLLAMYKGLMAKGISAADIDVMSRKNPARLLGLER
ncbi:MAG TPA: DUF6282 family protein [Vicinamibacterales bacterium]|jgi:hypothetical protein|nr:DUF6282 family protein [Vicinamibacterales bacterium]